MDLQDMTDLITAYDGICEVEEALELLTGGYTEEGALGKLNYVCEIIARHAAVFDENENWEESELVQILDSDAPVEQRAKKILGIYE